VSENHLTELHDPPVAGVTPDTTGVNSATAPRSIAVQPDAQSAPGTESRRAGFTRHVHRVRLYLYAFIGVALLVYVVALAASNTHRVRVDWVFGSSTVPLIWLVTLAVILGWLLGLLVAGVFRWRTRAPRAS
jgi:uncharacterized integral membrane protein